jgi:methylated-DNA-[protein]-cysteine S-methyltransferase
MTPVTSFYETVKTPFGLISLSTDNRGILLTLDFAPSPVYRPWCIGIKADGECEKAITEITEYINGTRKTFTVTCRFPGATVFQIDVWNTLFTIPYGSTASYSDIAVRVGRPKACRAVGNAVGENRIPIIIPCHRVTRKSGALGGFGPGPEIKKALLSMESRIIEHAG